MNCLISTVDITYVEVIIKNIIESPEFQRLQNIKQTDVLFFINKNATHTRYEHSIGVMYKVVHIVTVLQFKQPTLQITNEIIMFFAIAALCHDIGHVMFSHLFDTFVKTKTDNVLADHENRSILFVQNLLCNLLTPGQIKVICDLIHPEQSNYEDWPAKYKKGKWMFEIVSNSLTGIDYDRIDYIIRDSEKLNLNHKFNYTCVINNSKVINDRICYNILIKEQIFLIYKIRTLLHRNFYNTVQVKATGIVITNAFEEYDEKHNLSDIISNPDKMIELVDSTILSQKDNENIKKLVNQDIPKCVYDAKSDKKLNVPIEYQDTKNFKAVHSYIGFSENPLDNILFYDDLDKISKPTKQDYIEMKEFVEKEYFLRIFAL